VNFLNGNKGYFIPEFHVILFVMNGEYNEQHCQNNIKSLALAKMLFPEDEWINTEPGIYVAKSRMSVKYREWRKWDREMSQARLLTNRNSVVYFLPEKKNEGMGKIYIDTVINGEIVELKTVSGNRNTLGTAFEQGFKQGAAVVQKYKEVRSHSVFIRLLSDISIGSVKAKIAGELKNKEGNGSFICYFEQAGEFVTWSYDELRAMLKG